MSTMMLIDKHNMFIQDEYGQILLASRPAFSFKYVGISYNHVDSLKYVLNMGKWSPAALEPSEITEIEEFIKAQRDVYGVKIHAVDKDGTYLGAVKSDDPRIVAEVTPPPNDDHYYWDFNLKNWIYCHAVDEQGNYLGNIPHTLAFKLVDKAPPNTVDFMWSFEEEEYVLRPISIEKIKAEVTAKLDEFRDLRRKVLANHPQGKEIRLKLNQAVKAVLDEYGLTTLSRMEQTRFEVSGQLKTCETVDDVKNIMAVISVVRSEVDQLVKS